MIVHSHLIEAVATGHRESKTEHGVRVIPEIDAADEQIFIDAFENVVELGPGNIEVTQENILARLERALALGQRNLFKRVTRVDTSVGVAGEADVAVTVLLECFLESGKDHR